MNSYEKQDWEESAAREKS